MIPASPIETAPRDGTPIIVSIARYYGVPDTGHFKFARVSYRAVNGWPPNWRPLHDDNMGYGDGSFIGWWPADMKLSECEKRPRSNFKWVPSNETEGEIFQASWCARCKRDQAFRDNPDSGDGCGILMFTIIFGIGEAGYPEEWTDRDGKPKCTAFESVDDPDRTPRCAMTKDLFA